MSFSRVDESDVWGGLIPEELVVDVETAGWAAPVPDDVDLVTEVAGMMAVFAAERLQRVDGMRRGALTDAARYGGSAEIVERSVRLELAAALRITEHAAATLLAHAEAMVHRYPAALDALGAARLTEAHARVLVDLLEPTSPAVRERLSVRAVELAEELPVGSFRRALRRLVEAEESATLTERHEQALTQRRILVEPAADGMAWLHAFLPAVEAHAIHGRLTAMAKAITGRHAVGGGCGDAPDTSGCPRDGAPAEGDGAHAADQRKADQRKGDQCTGGQRTGDQCTGGQRTVDQVRADVFGDLLIEGTVSAHPGRVSGIRATVAVTVPALALLAACDGDRHAQGLAPATVEGIGPVPLDVARRLCGGEESWMRVLTHPETGMVLSVGRTQYRPPASLRRLIRWRADRCMAPGCGIPAHRCEIDHNVAWEHGGPTALSNHAPLCAGHHTVKHHGGWQVEHLHDQGGALLWTSPTGRQYLVKPERPVPVFRPTEPDGRSTAPF